MEREIGGYLELERNCGTLLHEGALALNSGRTALAYLIEQRGIRRIALPRLLCDVVRDVCLAHGVEIRWYEPAADLRLPALQAEEGEWLYVVNHYGRLSARELEELAAAVPRLIVDHAQAYFAPPVPGTDTIYTCRKFLGVPDGAFLYTDAPARELERDLSFGRMEHVLGRFERPAGEFYRQACENNDCFSAQPPLRMSRLTENLLRGLDYPRIRRIRERNCGLLAEALKEQNLLSVDPVPGPFAYPLMVENGPALRKKLIERKIFVPLLWPNVVQEPAGSLARDLAENILPLPCDQRYGDEDMYHILEVLQACMP